MNKYSKLLLFAVAILAGVVIAWQFYLRERITSSITPENSQALAYEVSDLFNSNEKLVSEIDKLNIEVDKLQESYESSKTSDEALNEKISNYKIILGLGEAEGSGVKIEFDKKISSVNLIDILNALKNIGVDGIAINGKRIIYNSSIEEGIFSPPVTIMAIGDKDLLDASLTRTGGIIEQIGFGKVDKIDNIVLPSI